MAEPGVAPGGSPRVGVLLANWPLPPRHTQEQARVHGFSLEHTPRAQLAHNP